MLVPTAARELFIFYFVCFVSYVTSWPAGAPSGACSHMTPNHSGSVRTDTPPYSLTLSKSTYSPGDAITLTLSATSGSFKGYLLEVRRTDDTLVGSFAGSSDGQTQCTNGRTHTDNTAKTTQSFTWNAPATKVGDLRVFVTIVQEKLVYWVMENLANITEAETPTTQSTAASSTAAASETTTVAALVNPTTSAADTTTAGTNGASSPSAEITTTPIKAATSEVTSVQTTSAGSGSANNQDGPNTTEDKSGLKSVDIIIIVITCIVAGLLLIGVLVMCIHYRIIKQHKKDEQKYRLHSEHPKEYDGIDVVSSGTAGTASTINYQDWMEEVKTEL